MKVGDRATSMGNQEKERVKMIASEKEWVKARYISRVEILGVQGGFKQVLQG